MYSFTCKVCGKEFESTDKRRKHCSMDCRTTAKELNAFKKYKNKKFGNLKVLDYERFNNRMMYVCKCDCGNIVKKNVTTLLHRKFLSCGCLEKKHNLKTLSGDKMKEFRKSNFVENTSIAKIISKKNKNNQSGCRGVSWNKSRGRWVAYITLQRKTKGLGYFDKIEDAVNARKEAEEKYFGPILKKYNKSK